MSCTKMYNDFVRGMSEYSDVTRLARWWNCSQRWTSGFMHTQIHYIIRKGNIQPYIMYKPHKKTITHVAGHVCFRPSKRPQMRVRLQTFALELNAHLIATWSDQTWYRSQHTHTHTCWVQHARARTHTLIIKCNLSPRIVFNYADLHAYFRIAYTNAFTGCQLAWQSVYKYIFWSRSFL